MAAGYTNAVWSYLPDYAGWVSNIFVKGPEWLQGVADCGGSTGPAPAPKYADNSTPNSSGATSPRTATLYGRLFELRYSATTECAWARISNGSIGDEVWLDRSFDGGAHWQQWLGYTRITSGRDAFTNQWNDNDLLMRARGKAGDRVEVVCTRLVLTVNAPGRPRRPGA